MFKFIPKYFKDRKNARMVQKGWNSLYIKYENEINRISSMIVHDMIIFGRINKTTTQEYNKLLKTIAAGLENIE